MANAASVIPGAPGPPRSLSPAPSRTHVVSPPSPLSMTPSTPGFARPSLFQRLGQPVVAETFQDCSSQAQTSWAYLSDAKMLELAEQSLRGLVAPELLRELDRRELVALVAAHQKASTHTQDFSGAAARFPSPIALTARGGSQSPAPPVLQSTPIRMRTLQQSASAVEVARTGQTALDATTTALMRARAGCPSLPSSVRLPVARREAANATGATVAMRVPVLQRQRMVNSRSSARFGGVVGARGVAIACSGRSPSPLIQRAVSSTALAFDGAAKATERSPSPTVQTTASLSSARVGDVQMERTFNVTPGRRSPSRGGRTGQIRRETEEANEVALENSLAASRSGCETGVANRMVSSRPRSALNRRGARTPTAPESLEMAVSSVRSSVARHSEGHTVSFYSPREDNRHTESDGQAMRRALDVRNPELCRDGNSGERTSRSSSPIARLEARRSGIDSTADPSVPIPFSSARRRLDTVLAEKLAAADRELSLAQGAATRFANQKIAQALNSSCSSEFSMATEDLSLGRRSEEYDAKLAAKMREIEVLQKQTEDNISRLAYSKHPSIASSKRPSREPSLSPPQELSRCDMHEKTLAFKYSSRSHDSLDKSSRNPVSNLDGCTGSTDVIRLSSGRLPKYATEGLVHASSDAAKEIVGSEAADGSPPNLSHSEDVLEKATPADSKKTSHRVVAGDSCL